MSDIESGSVNSEEKSCAPGGPGRRASKQLSIEEMGDSDEFEE